LHGVIAPGENKDKSRDTFLTMMCCYELSPEKQKVFKGENTLNTLLKQKTKISRVKFLPVITISIKKYWTDV
jgi:hypothetical protein